MGGKSYLAIAQGASRSLRRDLLPPSLTCPALPFLFPFILSFHLSFPLSPAAASVFSAQS